MTGPLAHPDALRAQLAPWMRTQRHVVCMHGLRCRRILPAGDHRLPTTGSDAAGDCIDCAAGTYLESTGGSAAGNCIGCAAGQYVEATGSTRPQACVACGAGKYVDVTGSSSQGDCINCGAGKYRLETGSDAITDCIECDRARTEARQSPAEGAQHSAR